MTGTTPTPAVWFVTGAARGMGIEFARAALEAGHCVVGTARDAAKVNAALGEHDNPPRLNRSPSVGRVSRP